MLTYIDIKSSMATMASAIHRIWFGHRCSQNLPYTNVKVGRKKVLKVVKTDSLKEWSTQQNKPHLLAAQLVYYHEIKIPFA